MVEENRFVKHRRQDRTNTIGYIGNFDKKDNIEQLITAFAELVTERPELQLKLLGYNRYKDQLDLWITEKALEGKVVQSGILDYKDIPLDLSTCDCLVLNRTKDTFSGYGYPIKLAEYLATSRPVLMSEIGSYDLEFEHQSEVYKFKADDPMALADAIRWRYLNYEKATAMGKKGPDLVKRKFHPSALEELAVNKAI